MRNRVLFLAISIIIAITTTTCRKELIYPTPVNAAMIGKIKTVVILGNSITRYGPEPSIGWYGDWGMDASGIEKDFVHLLIKQLHASDSSITVKFKNIADFETGYQSFDMHSVDSLKNANLIIMRIGENVKQDDSQLNTFINFYDQLIQYLDSSGQAVKLITDGFWDHPGVNGAIRNYALKKQFPLISITDLSKNNSQTNKGLAGHPSDIGMSLIEERIWSYVFKYF